MTTTVAQFWGTRVRGTPRRRVVGESVATFAFGLALVAIGLVGTAGTRASGLPSRWLFVLPLVAICLLLLLKRTRPGAALTIGTLTLVGDVAMGGSIGVVVGYFDLMYSTALWGHRAVVRRTEVLVGLAVVATGAGSFIVTGDLRASALLALVVFSLFATPLWWGRSVRSQAELARVAAARTEDLQRLSEMRQGELVRAERTRMAGDLHDALAGNLAAIGIHADAALSRPDAETAAADRDALTAIRGASVAASHELRAMVHILRSGEDQRTAPARLAEIDGVLAGARHRGLVVEEHRPHPWPRLPAAADHAGYRIMQEALTNAAKHAPGSHVDVTIEVTDDRLDVLVESTLTAPARRTRGGVGLVSMRERADALDGTFAAGPVGGVWRVTASIPLASDEGSAP